MPIMILDQRLRCKCLFFWVILDEKHQWTTDIHRSDCVFFIFLAFKDPLLPHWSLFLSFPWDETVTRSDKGSLLFFFLLSFFTLVFQGKMSLLRNCKHKHRLSLINRQRQRKNETRWLPTVATTKESDDRCLCEHQGSCWRLTMRAFQVSLPSALLSFKKQHSFQGFIFSSSKLKSFLKNHHLGLSFASGPGERLGRTLPVWPLPLPNYLQLTSDILSGQLEGYWFRFRLLCPCVVRQSSVCQTKDDANKSPGADCFTLLFSCFRWRGALLINIWRAGY